MRKIAAVLALLVALAAFPATSHAAFVEFFGQDLGLGEGTPQLSHPTADAARTSFLSNLTGVGTESFESYAAGTGAPLAITFPGAGTATLNGNGGVAYVPVGSTNGVGRYAISGTNYWESTDLFSIDFSTAISAFGFYGVDIGDFNGQVTLRATNGVIHNYIIPNSINIDGGSVLYYGFYDTEFAYDRIEFGNTNPGTDYFAFDDLTIGTLEQVTPEVPEPASMLLLGVVLGAGALFARRRKNS
jgi:hypothetical protein